MAGEPSTPAGSVTVQLEAEIVALEKGFESAQQGVLQFGRSVETIAGNLKKQSTQISTGFLEIDRATAQTTARIARMTQRLLALQLVVTNFGGRAADGPFSSQFRVANDALVSFGAIVSVFPNKIGLAVGALAAVATGIANLVGPTKAEREELEKLDREVAEIAEQRAKLDKLGTRRTIEREIRDSSFAFNQDSLVDRLDKENRDIQVTVEERERLIQKLVLIEEQLEANRRTSSGLSGPQLLARTDALIAERTDAKNALDTLTTALANQKANKALGELRREFQELGKDVARSNQIVITFFEEGLLDPIDALRAAIGNAEQELQQLLEIQAKMERAKPGSGSELGTSISEVIGRIKGGRQELGRVQETDRLAKGLSSSIADGIRRGVLEGASALETLEIVAGNLFENVVNEFTKTLETGLTAAFKEVTGIAGAEFASLITGVLGVAAAIFTKRKSTSTSFSNLDAGIQSSQLVRGVVSGPTNVAVASVASDLGRELVAVTSRLDVMLDQLDSIDRSTRRGAGASGGVGVGGARPGGERRHVMASLNLAYAAVLTVTEGDAGIVDAGGGLFYKEFAVPPSTVKPGSTVAQLLGVAESRIPTVPEPSLSLEHRGAFVVLQSATVLRLYWRGALAVDAEAGQEALTASVRLVDLDDIGDELLGLKYQLQRLLGYVGENMIQDLIVRDTVGNMVSYRLRVFNSKTNAENAEVDVAAAAPMATGELARVTRTVSIDIAKNDRDLLIGVLTDLAATPGVS